MNPPKVTDIDYIHFLIAAQRVYTWVDAAQSAPPAHDAFVRLLHRQPPDTPALWQDVAPYVQPTTSLLLLDDTTLDKPYTRKTALVTRHWRGKQQQVVAGINRLTLVWTDGQATVPCDCRVYDTPLPDRHTNNDHVRAMLATAKARAFAPRLVCFDSWSQQVGALQSRAVLALAVLDPPQAQPLGQPGWTGQCAAVHA